MGFVDDVPTAWSDLPDCRDAVQARSKAIRGTTDQSCCGWPPAASWV
jgi:hypothetical protein